jgi:hypothetical protein
VEEQEHAGMVAGKMLGNFSCMKYCRQYYTERNMTEASSVCDILLL